MGVLYRCGRLNRHDPEPTTVGDRRYSRLSITPVPALLRASVAWSGFTCAIESNKRTHGGGCTYLAKSFWAVEPLEWGTPGYEGNFTIILVLWLVHWNVGLVARTILSKSFFGWYILSSSREDFRKICCAPTGGWRSGTIQVALLQPPIVNRCNIDQIRQDVTLVRLEILLPERSLHSRSV